MPQQDLIEARVPRVRCVAGPGTGKTWAMQRRVEQLLQEDVDGDEIFAVTFTRHAASQLKSDLNSLDIEGAEDIHASTLHSHAFSILQREDAIAALGRHPRPLSPHEKVPLHHDLSLEIGNVQASRSKLQAVEAMWARLQHEDPGWPESEEDRSYQEAYRRWMHFHQALTIGELVPLAIRYIQMNPANEAQREFDHLIVDEYQDLNRADQELIDLLGQQADLVVIGDDDQSIYSFRHAHPEGIQEWLDGQDEPKRDVQIRTCRRCGGNIISLAESLISHNTGRIETELVPRNGREDDGRVDIVQWKTRNRETRGIARAVSEIAPELGEEEDVLVLVPRHEYGKGIGEELEQRGVESCKVHTKPDWEDEDLGQGLSLLTLLGDPQDQVALRYWLGLDEDDWRRDEYYAYMEYTETEGRDPLDVLQDEEALEEIGASGLHERWKTLQRRLENLRSEADEEILNELLPLEGSTEQIGHMVRERLNDEDQEDTDDKGLGHLADVVRRVIIERDEQELDPNINVMTYWGAKGLTAHTVIVTSLVNGILPGNPNPSNIEDEANLQEDRRLFYVNMTRPEEHLVLSSFRKLRRGEARRVEADIDGEGYWPRTQASRFLAELGPETPKAERGEEWVDTLQ